MRLLTLFLPGLLSCLITKVISGPSEDDTVTSYVPEGPPEYASEVIEAEESTKGVPSTKVTNSDTVAVETMQNQENTRKEGEEFPQGGSRSKNRSTRSVESAAGDRTARKKRIKELRTKFLSQLRNNRRRKNKQRSSHKSIKSKLEEGGGNGDANDANNTDYAYDYDSDYDYDYEEDSVYDFAEFQATVEVHIDETLSQVNESLQGELTDLTMKIAQMEKLLRQNIASTTQMEKLLRQNIARTYALEVSVIGNTNPNLNPKPNLGDLRLKMSSFGNAQLQRGYLQIYSGTCWGFVCDDFFDQEAAKVACIQMGHTGENATVDIPSTEDGSSDDAWKKDFPIVLDDVSCQGGEDALISCDHAAIGEHDCAKDEIVFISC